MTAGSVGAVASTRASHFPVVLRSFFFFLRAALRRAQIVQDAPRTIVDLLPSDRSVCGRSPKKEGREMLLAEATLKICR
jgi:hypothetical protein